MATVGRSFVEDAFTFADVLSPIVKSHGRCRLELGRKVVVGREETHGFANYLCQAGLVRYEVLDYHGHGANWCTEFRETWELVD
jgi:hypothetical protein